LLLLLSPPLLIKAYQTPQISSELGVRYICYHLFVSSVCTLNAPKHLRLLIADTVYENIVIMIATGQMNLAQYKAEKTGMDQLNVLSPYYFHPTIKILFVFLMCK